MKMKMKIDSAGCDGCAIAEGVVVCELERALFVSCSIITLLVIVIYIMITMKEDTNAVTRSCKHAHAIVVA